MATENEEQWNYRLIINLVEHNESKTQRFFLANIARNRIFSEMLTNRQVQCRGQYDDIMETSSSGNSYSQEHHFRPEPL